MCLGWKRPWGWSLPTARTLNSEELPPHRLSLTPTRLHSPPPAQHPHLPFSPHRIFHFKWAFLAWQLGDISITNTETGRKRERKRERERVKQTNIDTEKEKEKERVKQRERKKRPLPLWSALRLPL